MNELRSCNQCNLVSKDVGLYYYEGRRKSKGLIPSGENEMKKFNYEFWTRILIIILGILLWGRMCMMSKIPIVVLMTSGFLFGIVLSLVVFRDYRG